MTLRLIDDMRMQFLNLLSDIGFVDKSKGATVSPCPIFLKILVDVLFPIFSPSLVSHSFECTLVKFFSY